MQFLVCCKINLMKIFCKKKNILLSKSRNRKYLKKLTF